MLHFYLAARQAWEEPRRTRVILLPKRPKRKGRIGLGSCGCPVKQRQAADSGAAVLGVHRQPRRRHATKFSADIIRDVGVRLCTRAPLHSEHAKPADPTGHCTVCKHNTPTGSPPKRGCPPSAWIKPSASLNRSSPAGGRAACRCAGRSQQTTPMGRRGRSEHREPSCDAGAEQCCSTPPSSRLRALPRPAFTLPGTGSACEQGLCPFSSHVTFIL